MAHTRQIKRFGWIPDMPDHRDHLYSAPLESLQNLPPSADLRAHCPPVYDQGELGSCTGNAIAAAIEFDQIKQQMPSPFVPSRLFIYYNERVMEGTVDTDAGAMIRDGIKSVNKQGDCPETLWPYDITKFADKPPHNCYTSAKKHRAMNYRRVIQNLNQLRGCLASGFPFVFGFSVYESFMSDAVAKTGDAPLPSPSDAMVGGHAILAVGYDDSRQRFLFRNSWGESWGNKGYGSLPYAYLTDHHLASDFWTIRIVK